MIGGARCAAFFSVLAGSPRGRPRLLCCAVGRVVLGAGAAFGVSLSSERNGGTWMVDAEEELPARGRESWSDAESA